MEEIQQSVKPNNYVFNLDGLSKSIALKLQSLVHVLNQPIIDINSLKACVSQGIPDQASILREYSWKIILGYLPQEKSKWASKIEKQTATYKQFVKMFLPEERFPDYPIQMNKKHQLWSQLQEQFYLWEQVEKDTSRTHAQLSFFCIPTKPILIPYLTGPRKEKFKLIYGENVELYKKFMEDKETQRKTYRYDYMTRILYIYSKLNPKIQYVQGMNEILAPIFYVVNMPKTPYDEIEQASCFFMFNNAISDVLELHIKDLDKSQNGIHGKLKQINQMLVVIEPKVWSRLQELKIDPLFYSFRWMTLLFAQDFPLFDILRIWQSIFSAERRIEYMNYFAIALMVTSKEFILTHDFVAILSYLQNISEKVDLERTIKLANDLYNEFKDIDFKDNIQITKQALLKPKKQKKNWTSAFDSFLDKFNS